MGLKNSIRLASINIEGDTHRDEVISFLKDFKPDVVCLQELVVSSVSFFEEALDMKGYFLPMAKYHILPRDLASPIAPWGVGIFSSLPISDISSRYYCDGSGNLQLAVLGKEETLRRGLLQVTIKKSDEFYTIASTHFTRTPDGSASDKQKKDMKNLLAILEGTPELIFCGDFNAPRGGEIFGLLSEKYKDNIPLQYQSSLDPELHKLKNSKLLMVDGLFTTPQYKVSEVKLSDEVSDHMAITALIYKTI